MRPNTECTWHAILLSFAVARPPEKLGANSTTRHMEIKLTTPQHACNRVLSLAGMLAAAVKLSLMPGM